jgi:hypothetical protein
MNYTSLASNGTISAKWKEANTPVLHMRLTQKKLSVRHQPTLLYQNCVHEEIKADWSQEVAATIQSRIFSLPHLLSKNIKIKIHRTITLHLSSVVNPDPVIRSCRRVETSLTLTPPFRKVKSQSSNIVLGGYSTIRWQWGWWWWWW